MSVMCTKLFAVVVALIAVFLTAASATDCEKITSQSSCVSSACSWCTSGAVGSSCMTKADAASLPSSVFTCTSNDAALRQDIMPIAWPVAFSIKFASNITTELSVPVVPTANVMYYDSTKKLQRVDHGAGSYECQNFYNSELPCTIWFTPSGLFRKLSAPLPVGQPECCLDMTSIHASPPNWAVLTDPLPTYFGADTDAFSGVLSDHWKYLATDPTTQKGCHEYRQVRGDAQLAGRPLLFTFPVSDGTQDYHFDPASLSLSTPDANLFELPASCSLQDGSPFMCPQPDSK